MQNRARLAVRGITGDEADSERGVIAKEFQTAELGGERWFAVREKFAAEVARVDGFAFWDRCSFHPAALIERRSRRRKRRRFQLRRENGGERYGSVFTEVFGEGESPILIIR